jgi:O-antigen/teichoic acid export membrane protein
MSSSPLAFETLRKALAGNFIGRIVQVFTLLLSAIVLARLLGPEGLGIVAIVSATVRLAVIPAEEGANRLSERELAGAVGKADGAQARAALRFNIRASAAIALLGMGLVYLVLVSSAVGAQGAQTASILAAAVALFVMNICLSAARGVLRGEGQTTWAIRVTNAVTFSIPLLYLGWWYVFGELTPAIALWLQVASKVLVIPAVILLARRYWALIPTLAPGAAQMPIPRGWAAESVQFTVLGIVTVAMAEAGTLFLGYLGTPEEAGLFRIAGRVFLIANLVTMAAQQAYGPQIARMWQAGNRAGLEGPSRAISVLALSAAALSLVGIALIGRWLIVTLFGPAFEGAYLPAVIMASGALATGFGAVSPRLLKMTGEQRIVLVGSGTGLAVAVGLNLLLIPDLGATGCAIAFASAMTVARAIHLYGVKQHLGFWPLPNAAAARQLRDRIAGLRKRRR